MKDEIRRQAAPLKIGYLVQDFPPEVGAGPARVLEMSHRWQELGAQVTVITGMPNRRLPGRGDGVIDARYRNRLFLREDWRGIETLRSWLYTSSRRGFARTMVNNGTFAISSVVHALARPLQLDVLIASSPPFLPLGSGALLGAVRRIPVVMELRDLWPDYLDQMKVVRGVARTALFALEKTLLQRAARVVVVTESFKARVVTKGVAPDRIDVIPNGVDLSRYSAERSAPDDLVHREPGEFVFGYLGTFGRGQGLGAVVEAAAIVQRQHPRVRFLLVGDGPDRDVVLDAIQRHGATRVTVHPPISREATSAFYNSCDACLVPLAPLAIFQETVPSKLFEIMACERPFVAAVAGEAAKIVERSESGRLASPGNAASIAEACIELVNESEMNRQTRGRRAREFVAMHYDRTRLADQYLDILKNVARA